MRMTITAAAALIGLAAAFGPAGTASAGSLPDGTPVIEVGGRHSGGYRSDRRGGGRDYGHRGGRNYGHRGGRNYGHRGGRDYGHRGYARGYGHGRHKHGHGYKHGHGHNHGHGHDNYGPFIFGGIALGTYLFLDTLDHY